MNSYFNFKNEEEQENYNSQFKNLHCRMLENVFPRKDSLVYEYIIINFNFLCFIVSSGVTFILDKTISFFE